MLDVKLRSDQIRAVRLRLATLTGAIVFGTVFGFYVVWRTGELLLDKFVYDNPDFAIQSIEVQTDGVIPLDKLRAWSGVRLGENLPGLDLAAVKRNLELVSKLDTVSVERVLPQTLKIRVTERFPVAEMDLLHPDSTGGLAYTVFQLDGRGDVLQPVDPAQDNVPVLQLNPALPVIVWTNIFELQPGRRLDTPQLRAALQLISAYRHSPMCGLTDLRKIDVSQPEVIIATTSQGSEIIFGLQDADQQLRRWREIYDWGFRQGKNIATLDLSLANDIPVNWVMANANPETNPKPVKPAKSRRKNV